MKAFLATVAIGLGVMSVVSPAASQYRDRYYEREYRGFNEREYLRCNRDVWAAVRRGELSSGWEHYQRFGRREGRRLWCR